MTIGDIIKKAVNKPPKNVEHPAASNMTVSADSKLSDRQKEIASYFDSGAAGSSTDSGLSERQKEIEEFFARKTAPRFESFTDAIGVNKQIEARVAEEAKKQGLERIPPERDAMSTLAGNVWNGLYQQPTDQAKADYLDGALALGAIDQNQHNFLSMYGAPKWMRSPIETSQIITMDSSIPIDKSVAQSVMQSVYGDSAPYKLPETFGEAKKVIVDGMLSRAQTTVSEIKTEALKEYQAYQKQIAIRMLELPELVVKYFGTSSNIGATGDYDINNPLSVEAEEQRTFSLKYIEFGDAEKAYSYLLTRTPEQKAADIESYNEGVELGEKALEEMAEYIEENELGFLEGTWDTTKAWGKELWASFVNLYGYWAMGQQMKTASQQWAGNVIANGVDSAKGSLYGAVSLGKQAQEEAHEYAIDLFLAANADMEAALEWADAGDTLWYNAYKAGLDLVADLAVNTAAPGMGLVSMGGRVFARSTLANQVAGYDNADAVILALKDAAIEVASEKVFGMFGGIYGKSALGKATSRLSERFAEATITNALLKVAMSGAGESAEELIGGIADEYATRLMGYDETTGDVITPEEWADIFYDAIVGYMLGSLGGGASVANNINMQNTPEGSKAMAAAAVDNAYKIAAQKGVFSPEAAKAMAKATEARSTSRWLEAATETNTLAGARDGDESESVVDNEINAADSTEQITGSNINADDNVNAEGEQLTAEEEELVQNSRFGWAQNMPTTEEESLDLEPMTYEEQEDFLRERYADAMKSGILNESFIKTMANQLRSGTPLEDMVRRADGYIIREEGFRTQEQELRDRYAEEIENGIVDDGAISAMMEMIRGGTAPAEAIAQMDEMINDAKEYTARKEAKNGEKSSSGSMGRQSDVGTGEQSGGISEGAAESEGAQRRADTGREEARGNDSKKPQREKVSGKELKIPNGTDSKTLTVVKPKGVEARIVKAFIPAAKSITLVKGDIEQQTENGIVKVSGLEISDGRIWARMDHKLYSGTKLLLHECGHLYTRYDAELRRQMHNAAAKVLTDNGVEMLANRYCAVWRGLYKLPDGVKSYDELGDYFENNPEAYAEFLDTYEQEIFCDALAGLDRAKAPGASKLTDAIRAAFLEETGIDVEGILNGTVEGDTAITEAQGTAAEVEERAQSPPKYSEDEGADYEILSQIKKIGRKSINDLTTDEIKLIEKYAKKYWRELGTKSPFFRAWFGDWREHDNSIIQKVAQKKDNRGRINNNDTGWDILVSRKIGKETRAHRGKAEKNAVKYLEYIDDITEKAILLNTEISDNNNPLSLFFHTFYAIIEDNESPQLIKLTVEELAQEKSDETIVRDYILQSVEETPESKSNRFSTPNQFETRVSSPKTVADLFALVKKNNGNFHPPESSKIVNKDGTPKVMYRGGKSRIEVFDRKKSKASNLYGRGFYFTDNETAAGIYGEARAYYLDIKHPLSPNQHEITAEQMQNFLEAVAENEDYDIWNYGTTDIDDILSSLWGKGDFEILQDVSATAIGDLVETVELFNNVNGTEYDGIHLPTETVVFDSTQIKSADENAGTYNRENSNVYFSADELDNEYNEALFNNDMERVQELVDEAAKAAGYSERLYHQTDAEFTVFDTHHKGAGSRDNETPYGIFMKSTPNNIGLRGDKQMALYAKIQNPLIAADRSALRRKIEELSTRYRSLKEKVNNLDAEYQKKFDAAKNAWRDYVIAWRKNNPDADRRQSYDDPEFQRLWNEEERVTDEWTEKATELDVAAKEEITRAIIEAGYDGIILKLDKGSFGRTTDAYIAFNANQVKSADPVTYDDNGNVIPLSERFKAGNDDIRYSADDTMTAEEVQRRKTVKSRANSLGLQKLRERVASIDGQISGLERVEDRTEQMERELEQLKTDRKIFNAALKKKTAKAQQAKTDRQKAKEAAERAVDELSIRQTTAQSRKALKKQIFDIYGIKHGFTEIGDSVDAFTEAWISQGKIGYKAIEKLENMLMDLGEIRADSIDEHAREVRNRLNGGHISVPRSVANEFSDDWDAFRKRAFANGIYLSIDTHYSSIDQWTQDLAASFGKGRFDETLDEKEQLENIVDIAEQGRSENLTVWQMADYIAKTEGETASDLYIEDVHEQLMRSLKSFAQSAKIEMETVKRSAFKEVRRQAELKERMERAQREKEQREFQQKTLKQLQWLKRNQNIMGNDFQGEARRILEDIDTIAVSAANEMNWSEKHQATWEDLAKMYKWAEKNDPNFLPSQELENIVMRVEGKHLDELSASDLEEIYKAAVALRTAYYNRNNIINDELHRQFAEVFEDSVADMKAAPKPKNKTGKGRNYLDSQLNPIHRIERMFGWKENSPGFQIFGRGLEKGERLTKRYVEQANQMLDDWMTENEEWVRNSDGQGKDATWYELEVPELLEFRMGDKPIFGKTVKVYMTPMQKVYMYLESKNYDNLRHMAGGRTFADKELYSKGEYTEAFAQGTTVSLAPETVKKIVSDLTPKEMELAELLDKYFNGYAKEEINRVSNILYGYDRAMSDNYAPIFTNSNYNKSEPGIYQDGTAEGVGHMKTRAQGAKNPTYNISAMQAFQKHVSQTSRFVGMAIPAQNAKTLLNWSANGVTMQDHITHEWSQKELDALTNVMTELQAPTYMEQSEFAGILGKIMSNYIGGVFGANLTVSAKVLASKPTAAIVLGNDTYPSTAQQRAVDEELVRKYTSELDVRIRGLGRPELAALTLDEGRYQRWVQSHKLTQLTLGGGLLQAADVYVAKTMWAWAENRVRADFPDLEIGTQEQVDAGQSPFYKKVAEVYENAIGDTQSMYDIMHRSDIMRDTNEITRSFTIFHTDSLQAANLLRKRAGELQAAKASGNETAVNTAVKKLAVAAGNVILMNALVVLFDIIRDLFRHKDDKYKDDEGELTFWSMTSEALMQLMESGSGMLIGLDAIVPAIESVITGDSYFEHQVIAIDAFNDILKVGKKALTVGSDFISGFADVIENGGDVWRYLTEAADFRGMLKDTAEDILHYFSGVPIENVERLFTNLLGWVWPEMSAAYDGIWETKNKADLKQSTSVSTDIVQLYSGRGDISGDMADELARLYEAGYTDAVMSDTPSQFSVNGEEIELTEADKQRYNAIIAKNLDGELSGLMSSPEYQAATDEQKTKMLSKLYAYATARAKAEINPEYDLPNWVEAIPELRDAGIEWGAITEALVKQSELNKTTMTAGEKATAFAIWIDNKGYTSAQEDAIKAAVKFFSMVPAEAKRYEDLTAAGISVANAEEINDVLSELTPQAGSTQVSALQKVSAVAYMTISEADKEKAMKVIYSNSEKAYNRYMIARKYGVLSADYADFLEELDRIDVNGGNPSRDEFTEAVARSGFNTDAAREIWYTYWKSTSPWG